MSDAYDTVAFCCMELLTCIWFVLEFIADCMVGCAEFLLRIDISV